MIEAFLPEKESSTIEGFPPKLGSIEVLVGDDALALLSDNNFISEWDNLYQNCPWSTVFQSSDFVKTWYNNYFSQHSPILVLSKYNGNLTGLLPLAEGIKGLGIAGAGGWDAYYQTWLTYPCYGDTFISSALQAVKSYFPGRDIFLKYMPSQTPLAWLEGKGKWKQCSVLRYYSRPLLDMNHPDVDSLFRKKEFREKSNRLRRLGELKLEIVDDVEVFTQLLNDLADQYDFRKAATLNIMPFREDPYKKKFLVDLFAKGVLHTTILKVNEDIVAALIATKGRNRCMHGAGLNSHAPAYSNYSPGYVILQMLSIKLKQDGYHLLDLTPGGHSYKDRHANTYDEVFELQATSKAKATYLKYCYSCKELIKARMYERGINPRQLVQPLAAKIELAKEKMNRTKILLSLVHLPNKAIYREITKKNYILKVCKKSPPLSIAVKRNCLHDILNYSPDATDPVRWEFMKQAMQYYEAGFIPYTYCEHNMLKCLIWHSKNCTKAKEDKSKLYCMLSDGIPILTGLYCHSGSTPLLKAFLTTIVSNLAGEHGSNTACLTDSVVPKTLLEEGEPIIEVKEV